MNSSLQLCVVLLFRSVRSLVDLPDRRTAAVEMPMAKILIIDDEKGIRMTLREFLEEDGYDVSTADSAFGALALMHENRFELVLTDWMLPDLGGPAMLYAFRRLSPESIFVVVSGDARREDVEEALRAGAAEYLCKPVRAGRIRETAARYLHQGVIVPSAAAPVVDGVK